MLNSISWSLVFALSGKELGLVKTAQAIVDLEPDIVAEWISLDYAWDLNHNREEYISRGKYIVENNALAGVKVQDTPCSTCNLFLCNLLLACKK
jgi:hypothetical protein